MQKAPESMNIKLSMGRAILAGERGAWGINSAKRCFPSKSVMKRPEILIDEQENESKGELTTWEITATAKKGRIDTPVFPPTDRNFSYTRAK